MKDLFLRFCRWALPMLGITGIISCDNVIESPDMYGCPPVMYGPEPVALMQVKVTGKILDGNTGNPVKGISVSCDQDIEDPEVITSSTGEFVYESQAYPTEKLALKFEDADYSEDGSYIPDVVEVELTKSEDDSSGYGLGLYIAEDVFVNLYEDTVVAEYGCPFAEYSVKGRVVDADKNPINNIEVLLDEFPWPVRTDEDGSFHVSGEAFPDMPTMTLRVTDTDGEENGGEFESKEVEVEMEHVETGDGGWYEGRYESEDVEIVLERKQP